MQKAQFVWNDRPKHPIIGVTSIHYDHICNIDFFSQSEERKN